MPRAVKTKAASGSAGAAPAAKKASAAKRNKLYAMPEKIAEGTVLTDLSKAQWRVGPSIGIGGFGEIYSACRVGEKNYDYVVKCEPHGNGPLFVEMHFYMRNARQTDIERFKQEHNLKSFGMPYMVGNGSVDLKGLKHRFIVMPRYGSDIARHFLANGRRLPEGTVYRIALQMLDVYEFVHSCGYVHADLKAGNILLGHGKGGGTQAYLVDYGLASHYTTKEFKPDPKKMHNGTMEYTSRDAHQGVATMRADLEILGYNMIEWCGAQLPWVKQNLLAVPTKVQKAKEDFMLDVSAGLKSIFPTGVPGPIVEFMKYVAKMQYNETPDYEKCRKIFANALKTMKIPNSGDLELSIRDNNGPSTSKGKTNAKPTKRPIAIDSSVEMCASDDDDDDVIFDRKKPTKVAPQKATLKTSSKTKPKQEKVSSRKSPNFKISPKASPSRRALPTKYSPLQKSSATLAQKRRTRSASPSPLLNAKRNTPAQSKRTKPGANEAPISSSTPLSSSTSTHATRSTPLSAKANINFNPAISMSKSSAARPGKTIVNDNTTPNARAGKTYEFNFELDVSMDANVIVNVKRKKKAAAASTSDLHGSRVNGVHRGTEENGESPATRVKVRKIASADDIKSSPRTPAVTVKKSKRIVTPR